MFSLRTLQRGLLPVFIVIYAILSLYTMAVFVPGSGFGINNNAGPVRPPLAYRPMMPMITGAVRSVIPDRVAQGMTPVLEEWRDSKPGMQLLRIQPKAPLHFAIDHAHIFDTTISMLVVYASLIVMVCMVYNLAAELMPESRAYALLAPVLVMLHVCCHLWRAAYTYDFAEIFFSCALLYLLRRQEWKVYLICLAAATLNKETTVFCVLFFTIWFYHVLPRQHYVRLMLAQWAVYIVVEGTLHLIYADVAAKYSGQSYVWQVKENFIYWLNFGYLSFLAMIGTIMLLTYQWKTKPLMLRAGLWMVAMNIGAFILICHPGEYRDLFWGLPIVTLLMTHTVVRVAQADEMEMFRPIT